MKTHKVTPEWVSRLNVIHDINAADKFVLLSIAFAAQDAPLVCTLADLKSMFGFHEVRTNRLMKYGFRIEPAGDDPDYSWVYAFSVDNEQLMESCSGQ